jgi:coenzyme PQQ precursor peptide PqqA
MTAGQQTLQESHENHEGRFMIPAGRQVCPLAIVHSSPLLNTADNRQQTLPGVQSITETIEMKWETPTACDFRFGFEITMYIAAR